MISATLLHSLLFKHAYDISPSGKCQINSDLIEIVNKHGKDAFFLLSNLLVNYDSFANNYDLHTIDIQLLLILASVTKMPEVQDIINEYKASDSFSLSFAAHLAAYYIYRDKYHYNQVKIKSRQVLEDIGEDLCVLLKTLVILDETMKLPVANIIQHLCKVSHEYIFTEFIQLLDEIGLTKHLKKSVKYIFDRQEIGSIIASKYHPIIYREIMKDFDKLSYADKKMFIGNMMISHNIDDCEFLLNIYNKSDKNLRVEILETVSEIIYDARLLCMNKDKLENNGHNNSLLQKCDGISEIVFKYIIKDIKKHERRVRLLGLCGGRSAVKVLNKMLMEDMRLNKDKVQAIFNTLDKDIINRFVEIYSEKNILYLNLKLDYADAISLIDRHLFYEIKNSIEKEHRRSRCYNIINNFLSYAMKYEDKEVLILFSELAVSTNTMKYIKNPIDHFRYLVMTKPDYAYNYFTKFISSLELHSTSEFGTFIDLSTFYISYLTSAKDTMVFNILEYLFNLPKDIDRKMIFLAILSCNNRFSFNLILRFSNKFCSILDKIRIINSHMLDKQAIIDAFYDFLRENEDEEKILSAIKILKYLDENILKSSVINTYFSFKKINYLSALLQNNNSELCES